MTVGNLSLVDGNLQALLSMASVSIIDTPKLGPRNGDIEILGDCTSRIISDAAELFRTHLRRSLCATAVKR